MKLDFNLIIKKYQRNKYFFDHLYFPAQNAKRMIVFFSSMGLNRYDRVSWFFDPSEQWNGDTACLFIKDDTLHYFLGTEEKPLQGSIKRLIDEYMALNKLKPSQVFAVGGSMGGYAAIYYASFLGLNAAIVANPQVNKASTIAHEFSNWEERIIECGDLFKDLDYFVLKRTLPNLYIEYGNYPAYYIAVKSLLRAYRSKNGLCISRKANWAGHTVDCLSRFSILNSIFFFEHHGFNNEKAPRAKNASAACVPDINIPERIV